MTCGKSLKILANDLKAKLSSLNVPEGVPPDVPRAVIATKDLIFGICFSRFHFTVVPPEHIRQDFESSIQFARKKVKRILDQVISDEIDYRWTGAISELRFPVADKRALEAIDPVFRQIVNSGIGKRRLSSFQLQYGFEESGFYHDFTILGYEQRKYKVGMKLSGPTYLEVEKTDYELEEAGIQINYDINDKPKSPRGDYNSDLSELVDKKIAEYPMVLPYLGVEGLL